MRARRSVRGAGTGTLLLLLAGAAIAAESSAPVKVVETMHTGMVDVMKVAATTTFEERATKLEPVIDAAYDLDFMGRKSLGKSFDTLSPEDQKRWLEAFHRFMVANYAGRFTSYSGQKFETLGDEPAAQDTVLVRTRLIDPGKENVDLAYRLRQQDGTWKIIDVYLKGTVSELALRRSDFTAILDRQGFAALMANLDEKIADLRDGKVK
ncbi:ABC transporter substrate-binding protein [Candidatus Binatia bacterium]|nr:ABC transporter substrate-binding protein [Candidatus Binatia bacterium]